MSTSLDKELAEAEAENERMHAIVKALKLRLAELEAERRRLTKVIVIVEDARQESEKRRLETRMYGIPR